MTIKDRWSSILVNAPIIYILLYMFIPYKPWGLSATPSTLFLIVSLPFLLKKMSKTWITSVGTLEKTLICSMIITLIISVIINKDVISLSGVIACLSSVLGFLYVRHTYQPEAHQTKLFNFFQFYIFLTGVSIILEVLLGRSFFISNYLIEESQRNPGYRFGSGFAPYASLTGGLILWPLSMLTVHYVMQKDWNLSPIVSQKKSLLIILLGIIGLYYTLARSSWVGFTLALVLALGALIIIRGRYKYFLQIFAGFTIIFASISFIIPKNIYYTEAIGAQIIVKTESIPHLANYIAGKTVDVPTFPQETKEAAPKKSFPDLDPSANTRILIYEYATTLLAGYPMWGIGIDRFPMLYETHANALKQMDEYKNVEMDALTRLDLHNFILTYLIEIGIIPAAFFFLLIFFYFFCALKSGVSAITFPPFVGLVSVCLWMCFTGFLKERPLWLAMGILGACLANNLRIKTLKKDGINS